MSVQFQRIFRVRHYECDAYGHLNNVNYVRYMQEAALDASAAVGWDIPRYQAIGRMWLIRETDVEYIQPLHYNEDVTVTTWVADFRRVQSRRQYEFRRSDDEVVARASTNWVFLDRDTQRPATIPDEVIQAFSPNGTQAAEHADKFPELPPAPANVFTLRKRVEWRDIDAVGHVNNAAYMSYCEDAATQVGRTFGWSMQRMIDEGFAIIARRFRILYLQSALMDDEVDIACWFSDAKRATAIRHYTLHRVSDRTLLAQAQALWVCFDLKRQRPMQVPQHFLDDFMPNMSPQG